MSAVPILTEDEQLWQILIAADDVGVKLEIVDGRTSWELFPGILHQEASFRIQSSIRRTKSSGTDCGCYHLADVYVKFAEGSIKRPDLAIWCTRPKGDDGFVTQIPEVVIEILSPGSKDKDLVVGPPFYLTQGVHDVIVINPRTNEVFWFTKEGLKNSKSPSQLTFECGCQAMI